MATRRRNTHNAGSGIFRRLTRIFSGPIVNYQRQTERSLKRRRLVKYGSKIKSIHGNSFKKSQYFPFENLMADQLANQHRAERYYDFDAMEMMPEIACIAGDTRVSTLEGFFTIKELCEKYPNGEGFETWAWDNEKCSYMIGNAHHPRKTGNKRIVEVVIDNGKSLKCTLDHRIMLIDGTYKQAKDLLPGDALNPFLFKNKEYMKIKNKNGKFVSAHRFIFESVLGKETGKGMNIHHINHKKYDNRISNLNLMTAGEHARLHGVSIETNEKRSKKSKISWEESSQEEKDKIRSGIEKWQSSDEGHKFMSEHTSQLNRQRWAENQKYREKMISIFSNHAKEMWSDPKWAAWKRKKHSETMRLKYANDPELRERTTNRGDKNGRFKTVIPNERILLEGLRYDSIFDFARNFDFEGMSFKSDNYRVQFLRRRLSTCGFKTWREYKEKYEYNNHKVVKVNDSGQTEDVYDLTVDVYENFCLENGMIISNSALDIYGDEMTTYTKIEPMMTIKCPNEEIKEELLTLFRDILNLDYNLFGWCRTLCKYGDFFLYLDVDEESGVKTVIPLPTAEVERLEGEDKTNPNYIQFQWNIGQLTFENWQMAHFRILGNDKHAPYGSAVLDPARRIWKQLTLLEDAMMSYRIVRSPERRVFYVDVGGISPEDTEQFMELFKTAMKRNSIADPNTGKVDLRYNPLSIEDDYYIPTRGGASSTRIETLQGGQYTGDIDDVKYLRDKLFSALKIPQSYLSRSDESSEDQQSLTQKDIRFARTIQRIQQAVTSELDKIAKVHLYTLGYRGNDLLSFSLLLNNPSRIADLQELEHWRTKFDVASSATEGYFSRRWIGKNLLNLTDEQILQNQRELFYDKWYDAQLSAIEEGGGDSEMGGGLGAGDFEDEEDFDLEDEGAAEEPEEGASDEDETLLAAPAKRDDKPYLTPGAKGKAYTQVKSDRRGMGARKRHLKSKYGAEMASSTGRNIFKGAGALSSLARGISETIEKKYDSLIREETIYDKEEQEIEKHTKEAERLTKELGAINTSKAKQLTEEIVSKVTKGKGNEKQTQQKTK